MSFLLTFSLFILSLLHHAHAYLETRPSQVFPITTGTSHFIMDLDYPQAFEVTITAFNKKEGDIGFCDTTPSKITPKLEWNGPIRLNDVPANSSDTPVERFYDNILYYKGWYFILDSLSFEITAIKDPRDSTTYVNIKSEFQNEKEDEQIEDTYFILDPDDEFIYIITRKDAYLYPLDKFFSSVKAKKTPPRLSEVVEGLPGYDMILSIRYYQNKLYVVADNEAQVFAISKNGDLTSQIKFDRSFFGNATEVAITDIVFKGNFAYVLDKLKGIYVVDISKSNSTEKITADKKYVFQPDDTRQVQKGQYIEIVQDSLHVVSSGGKNPFIFEYIIKGDMLSPTLEFNRKIELFQSIRDTFTDSNYLYLITGFFNMATKHSIPGRYHSENVEDYLAEYWPLVGARALTAQASGNVSKVAVINEDSLTILRFQESNPFISCNTGGLTEGSYTYSIHAVQRDCPAKEAGDEEDYNAVCEISQDIEILIVKNTIDVGNIAESKKKVNLLLVGVGILGLLILVFVCLFRKYKVKYHLLEDRMKFHKLDEDNTEAGIKGGAKKEVDSHQDINPYNINIAAELRKEEQKEKRKSPHKSPIKEAQKVEAQPNAEFGDLKPLDIEEIYGHKAKAGEDDSF